MLNGKASNKINENNFIKLFNRFRSCCWQFAVGYPRRIDPIVKSIFLGFSLMVNVSMMMKHRNFSKWKIMTPLMSIKNKYISLQCNTKFHFVIFLGWWFMLNQIIRNKKHFFSFFCCCCLYVYNGMIEVIENWLGE